MGIARHIMTPKRLNPQTTKPLSTTGVITIIRRLTAIVRSGEGGIRTPVFNAVRTLSVNDLRKMTNHWEYLGSVLRTTIVIA